MKRLLKRGMVYVLVAMMMFPAWLITSFFAADHAYAFDVPLPAVISELYVEGSGNNWLEFYNPNRTEPVSLAGYTIEYPHGSGTYARTIKDGIAISPLSPLAIGNNEVTGGGINFNETTGYVTIKKPDTTVLKTLDYDSTTYPDIDELGNSLQLNNVSGLYYVGASNKGDYSPLEPQADIDLTPDLTTYNDDYLVTPTYENTKTKEYRLDSGDWQLYQDVAIPVASKGLHTFYARGTDAIGLYSTVSKEFTIDRNPELALIGDNPATVYFGESYTDPGAAFSDDVDPGRTVMSGDSVNKYLLGEQTLRYNATDTAGNSAVEVTRTVNVVAKPNQSEASGTNTLTKEVSEIIVPDNLPGGDITIDVPQDVTNGTLNLAALLVATDESAEVTLANNIFINIETPQGNIQVVLPAGMKITGSADWNGIINLAQPTSSEGLVLPLGINKMANNTGAYELGAGNLGLMLDGPAKITFVGGSLERVGYIRDGSFVEIQTICDDPENPTNVGTGECKIVFGIDLIVWTSHFTQFVSYTEIDTPISGVSDFTATVVDKDGGKVIRVQWNGVGAGVDDYLILVNSINSNITPISGDNTGAYSVDIKVATDGNYTVSVVARRSGVASSAIAIKTVTVKFPVVTASLTTTTATVAAGPTTSETVEEPVVNPEPKSNVTAPKEEVKTETKDSGTIKGEETTDEAEAVNWTPWIVLFALIILAGAATGGYFYWFAGKDDDDEDSEEEETVKEDVKKIKKQDKPKVVVRNKPKNTGKRW